MTIRMADIVESVDDGGWYARVEDYDTEATGPAADAFKPVAESRIL